MGSLKETNPSLWVNTTPHDIAHAPLPVTPEPRAFDVAVVGGGITGLSTALALVEQGASVVLLEAGRLCSGVSGYTTAKVTSLHGLTYAGLMDNRGEDVARAYGEANETGLARVADWVERFSIDCDFERRAAYTYTTTAENVESVEAEVRASQQIGLPASRTTETELPFEVLAAVRFEDQAQFHPRRYCLGLAAAITSSGGTIHEGTRVLGVGAGAPCRVETQHGEIRADHVVLATQLPFLDRGAFFAKTHPMRSYAMAVRLEAGAAMPRHMYLGKDEPTRSLRTAFGDDVLIIGGEGHKVGADPDTRQRYQALAEWARTHFAVASIEAQWSAQDYVPVDGTPFIGRLLPGSSILVATGFQKWGMTTGTAAAQMLADIVAGRDNPWLFAFDSTRIKDVITSRSTYSANIDAVGKHFAGDRLKTMSPPAAATLAPGEGGIVELDGAKVAAYRTDAGDLRSVSPVCKHLGCLVSFNTAEKTWDCPCHGSRFDTDGRVIQGPSLHDLDLHDGAEST